MQLSTSQLSASHPHRPRALACIRPLALATLLALAPAAFAQDAAQAPQRIEDQMTAAQFRAAGLDQLSDEQLANLNDWLNREIDSQSTQAAQAAVARVEQQQAQTPKEDRRGLFDFGSRDSVVAHITGEFRGFDKGRRYELDNGQVWEQVDGADLPGVTLDNPKVEISPSLIGRNWYLQVEGYNTRAKVRRVE